MLIGETGRRACGDEIRLAAQECGDLQAVHHTRGGLRLFGPVHVREDGKSRDPLHAGQDAQTLVEPRTAEGSQA